MRHGEVFSVVFGTFARFAPTEARTGPRPELILRPFGAGLLDSRSASPSMMAFVLLLLSTVLYDGLLNTPEWTILENAIGALLRSPGEFELIAVRSAGLVAFWLLFLGAYTLIAAMMSAAAGGSRSPREIAQRFAFTLVPIAIGYHLAHYLVFLLVQGQYIIPLMSDPFGWGWNLFGTAGYRVDIAVIGARFAWYTAVAAILVGHMISVYLAHMVAMREFEPRRRDLAIPGPAHRADGGLHLHQPFDSRRADRRTARAGTSVGDRNRRHRHSELTRCCPNPGPAACNQSARTNSQSQN